jgi:hypothetical protein
MIGRPGGGDGGLNAGKGHTDGDVEHGLLYALQVTATLILFRRTLENEAVKAPTRQRVKFNPFSACPMLRSPDRHVSEAK